MSTPGTCEQVTGTLPVWVMVYSPLPIESISFWLSYVSSLLSLKELQGKYQGKCHQEASPVLAGLKFLIPVVSLSCSHVAQDARIKTFGQVLALLLCRLKLFFTCGNGSFRLWKPGLCPFLKFWFYHRIKLQYSQKNIKQPQKLLWSNGLVGFFPGFTQQHKCRSQFLKGRHYITLSLSIMP